MLGLGLGLEATGLGLEPTGLGLGLGGLDYITDVNWLAEYYVSLASSVTGINNTHTPVAHNS